MLLANGASAPSEALSADERATAGLVLAVARKGGILLAARNLAHLALDAAREHL